LPAPPASPQSTYCTEEFKLDLSSLAADEDELIITNNESEICYREFDTVFNESNNECRGATEDNHVNNNNSVKSNGNGEHRNSCSKAIEIGDTDNIESAGKAIRLLDCDKESEDKLRSQNQDFSTNTDSSTTESRYSDRGRISSDIFCSNQSFGDERSGSTGSYLSGSSSYVTLSEYSVDSCSSASSLRSRKSHQREISTSNGNNYSREPSGDLSNNIIDKKNKVEQRSVELAVESPIKGNGIQQLTRSLPNENLSRNPEKSRQVETSNQKSSGVITNSNMVTELQIPLSCGGEDNACASNSFSVITEGRSEKPDNFIISSMCKNANGISTTSVEQLTEQCVEVNERKYELNNVNSYVNFENKYIASDKASDNVENDDIVSKSSKLYGQYYLNKGHEIQTEERIIEGEAEQVCLCCAAGNMKIHSCLSNSFLLHESNTQSSYHSAFCDTSARCSGSKGHFDEKPVENAACVDKTSQNTFSARVKAEPASSGLKSPQSCGNYVSLTNLEKDEDYGDTFHRCNAKYQVLPGYKRMLKQDLYSSPIRPHTPNTVESLSVMTSDCESGRRSGHLLERLDSGYFPDISLPAGEFMEAVICARKLVCVLERALDRTLSWNTNDRNIDSSVGKSSASSPRNSTRRKERSNSLSPSILRRCKETDSACSSTVIEFRPDGKHSVLDTDSAAGKQEGVNPKEICHVKPPFSCDGVGTPSCSYVDVPPLLIVSAEELQKQRTLLKPATDRVVHGTVVQVVDMADILRSTIFRRRKFLDPSDEVICGNNRQVSESSLENT
jgi:hypothetical protein